MIGTNVRIRNGCGAPFRGMTGTIVGPGNLKSSLEHWRVRLVTGSYADFYRHELVMEDTTDDQGGASASRVLELPDLAANGVAQCQNASAECSHPGC